MTINLLSIFSGGGGIDLGFHNAGGYRTCFASDYWQPACDTLVQNKMALSIKCCDIRHLDYELELKKIDMKISDIDVLVGGPPCPAYSKSRFYRTEKKRALEDENSFTLHEYFRALEKIRPKLFFFENVSGFVYKPHKEAFELLCERSNALGYEINFKVINSADYGVPQIRERFICVGVHRDFGSKFIFPTETHVSPEKIKGSEKKIWKTCGDVMSDLDVDLPEDNDMAAGSKDHALLKLIPPGENYLFFTAERGHPNPLFKWRSRYWSFLLKLSPQKPSWTIQASFSNNMGPFHWKSRFLRISEIKRIQTFQDDYEFCGDFRDQWRQIGNAVPPLLVEQIAKAIRLQYFRSSKNVNN